VLAGAVLVHEIQVVLSGVPVAAEHDRPPMTTLRRGRSRQQDNHRQQHRENQLAHLHSFRRLTDAASGLRRGRLESALSTG
jgi:hypothetical protein